MTNIFERSLNLTNQCMKCVYGELFEPIESDKDEIIKRLKTAMLTHNKVITLNGTKTVETYSEEVSAVYEDMLNAVAKQMGELV